MRYFEPKVIKISGLERFFNSQKTKNPIGLKQIGFESFYWF